MKLVPILFLLGGGAVSPLTVTAQMPVLLRTFHNPTPAIDDNFGSSMAALGNDRVLIGARYDDTSATNAGAVYLFHTNGTLLTTITNPIPTIIFPYGDEQFGSAIATVGNDRVAVGSPMSGRVFLFATNGALVTTLNSSNDYDVFFGNAVAAFGNDRVLIGARGAYPDNEAYTEAGAAYLYSTNGAHLMTFSNPYAGNVFELGSSVAAFGNDRVLIGAPSYGSGLGQVLLFNTNGTLLTAITNPGPFQNYFAYSIAAVGEDRIVVGAPHFGNPIGNTNFGSVYVFNTNGTLLTTILNPTPVASDWFGDKLAALGSDRVIIGASGDDPGATDAGSAYVYSINGTLIATINNPAPADYDRFGHRLAAFGSEGAIIGAMYEDTGASMAGSAYLFSIPATPSSPALTIQRTTTNSVVVSWPAAAAGFVLQQNTNGLSSIHWSNVMTAFQIDGSSKSLVFNPTNGNRFYRLIRP